MSDLVVRSIIPKVGESVDLASGILLSSFALCETKSLFTSFKALCLLAATLPGQNDPGKFS
jgi:hypothetical protein